MVFLAGLVVLATGAAFMIKSSFGSATWDVLHLGLSTKSSWSIGLWVQIVGLVMIGLACLIDRTKPQIGSFINIILLGFFLFYAQLTNLSECHALVGELVFS